MVTVENAQIAPNFDHQVIVEPIKGQIFVAIAGERTSNAIVRAINFPVPLSYYGFRNECFDTHWCMHNFTSVNLVNETGRLGRRRTNHTVRYQHDPPHRQEAHLIES